MQSNLVASTGGFGLNRPGAHVVAARRERTDGLIRTVLLFVIPFMQFIQLNVVGQLALSDIMVLLLAPYFLVKRGFEGGFESRAVYAGIGLWALGAFLSDMYAGTAPSDYMRGWMRIVTLFCYIYVFASLIANRIERIAYWGIGYGLGAIIALLIIPNELATDNPYKFGVGLAIINLVLAGFPLLLPGTQKSPTVRMLVLFALAALSLYNDARSMFAFCFVAGVIVFFVTFVQARFRHGISSFATVVCFVSALVALGGARAIYTELVEGGHLGAAMLTKYEDQTKGDTSLLLAGRPELLVSLQAVADSPIIGRGSWARSDYYNKLKIARLESSGVRTYVEDLDVEFIPSHSAIINSWIEAGILGVPVWIIMLVFVVRFFLNIMRVRTMLLSMIVVNAIGFSWDVMFSPITVSTRLLGPLSIVVVCKVLEMMRVESRVSAPSTGGRRMS